MIPTMSNDYFRFKQFMVRQEQCAMKVCTDACILGAWFSEKIPTGARVLDLGSGTGLLMLMLAQKNNLDIQGIELDLFCFEQLQENLSRSRWRKRLRAFPGDARNYSFPHQYDFIISNPPFFEHDLPSASEARNLARHAKTLSGEELLQTIDANLDRQGTFGLLLPYDRANHFEQQASARNFYVIERLSIQSVSSHGPFRSVLQFSRNRENFVPESELTIYGADGQYSAEFTELMQDFYLNL